ncbi:Ovate family protein [Zostera marina]|uniref:Transcription repressor n=1 Tax=Zostera marina TaxID=29655 RepID=A0A0K9P7Y8_ZOSMR|nr:Ovate family protein [Zostera marina]
MSSTITDGRRKFTVRHPMVVDVGCSCRRTKSLVSFFTQTATRKPKLNPETPPNHHHHLSSYYPFSPSTTNCSTSHHHNRSLKKKKKSKRVGGVVKESVAVVKESEDPYHDFRDSMLQMILEKDIYAWDDLRELLHRFLSLNSPYHHDSILRAFAEIWNDLFNAGKRGCTGGAIVGGGMRRKNYKKQYYHTHMATTTTTKTRQPMRHHHT